MLIKHPKDFWAGVMFIAFGVAALGIGSAYPLGTAGRMGPGYFPRILGIILLALGALVSLRAFRLEGAPIPRPVWRPLLVVLISVTLFAILLPIMGLVVAIVVLVIGSSLASHEFTWRATIISSAVLAIFCVLAFAYGLKLQFPLWPAFMGR